MNELQTLQVKLSEAQAETRNAKSLAEINRGYLQTIFEFMDGVEWDAETLDQIAQTLRHAGYTINEPGERKGEE